MLKKVTKTEKTDDTLGEYDIKEQLALLRKVTDMTGGLHDAQILQLKTWPLIVTHATASEFEFNFEKKTVQFNLSKLKGKSPKNLKARLKNLSQWTKNLLGDEYKITVNASGKVLYSD